MDYAEAIYRLEAAIDEALADADENGLTNEEQARLLEQSARQLRDAM